MTEREAAELQAKIIKDKSEIAPKARGTAVKGDVRELPECHREYHRGKIKLDITRFLKIANISL